MPYDLILKAMSFGLHFTAKDESGVAGVSDTIFLSSLHRDFDLTMIDLLEFDPVLDRPVIEELKKLNK